MGSRVTYRDDKTGRIRQVTLVYPEAADIDLNRISVLAPVQTPTREKRPLTVLAVSN